MSDLAKPLTEKPEPPELWAGIALIAGIFAVGAAFSISGPNVKWERAEIALAQWEPTTGRIDHIARRYKKRTYEIFSGYYHFHSDQHRFQTKEFESDDLSRSLGRYLRNNSDVTIHVNPTNPSESVFEAVAQRELYRTQTNKARYLSASCGVLCIFGVVMHIYDRRRFARKFSR